MTRNLHAYIGLLILLLVLSCTKENVKTYSIHGLWIGTYTVDANNNLGEQYFSFIIKPDGTMINETKYTGRQHLSPGTWTLKGDSLLCTFTCVYGLPEHIGITETSSAKWNEKESLLSGTWKNVPPLSGTGGFKLKRVN